MAQLKKARTIQVEQKHIDEAVRHTTDRCPISLAAAEQIPDRRWVAMGEALFYSDPCEEATRNSAELRYVARLGEDAVEFQQEFDDGIADNRHNLGPANLDMTPWGKLECGESVANFIFWS